MKNILVATGLALVLLAPATFAQGTDSAASNSSQAVTKGGAAGASGSQALAYGGLAALTAGGFIATVAALNSGENDTDNVNVGPAGTTGTTGTTP